LAKPIFFRKANVALPACIFGRRFREVPSKFYKLFSLDFKWIERC